MIIDYFYILLLILFLDFIWITISFKMYKMQIERVQKETMTINIYAALFTYLIIALGLLLLIQSKKYKKIELIAICALFGFFTYSIYNFTSLAIYKNYPLKVAIIDTLWGTFLCLIIGYSFSNYYI